LNSDASSAWTVTGTPCAAPPSSALTNSDSPIPISPVESARNTSPSANSWRSSSLSGRQSGVTPPLTPKSTSDCRAYSSFWSNVAPSTVGGSVFGWSTTVVTPPAAALFDPVSQVSLWSKPGWRKWTCASIIPGSSRLPVASTTRSSAAASSSGATVSIVSPLTRTSRVRPSASVAFRMSIPTV
jgi:hypothetical protein